jgi:mono/diheme cytochrome c family protein
MGTLLFLLGLTGCGTPAPTAPTSAPPPQPSSAPAAVAAPTAPAAPVNVGPDGPESIPVPAIELSTDPAVIAKGQAVFDAKGCGACHQFGSKLVGPDLDGVLTRRTPTWAARMVLHPEIMTKEDPTARKLFAELMVQMTNQGVPPEDVPALLSFLKSKETKK